MKMVPAFALVFGLVSFPAFAAQTDMQNNLLNGDRVEATQKAEIDVPEWLGMDAEISEATIFPATGDTRSIASGTNPWNAGDSISGDRILSLDGYSVTASFAIVENTLVEGCGVQSHVLMIDRDTVGSFSVAPGDTQVDVSFTGFNFASGTHTISIVTTETVSGGCGSAGFSDDVSEMIFEGDEGTGGCSASQRDTAGNLQFGFFLTFGLVGHIALARRRRREDLLS